MAGERLNIYIASNVNIDYFKFLGKTLESSGYNLISLYLISEQDYRTLARSSGVSKIRLRVKMYIFYPLYLMYKGLTCKSNSIFIVTSNTFFAPLLVRFITKLRDVKVIHLLYDLYPDALEVAGLIARHSFQSKLLGKIMRLSQLNCNATVYLGGFLKSHAEKRWGFPKNSKVIDISTDLSFYTQINIPKTVSGKLIIHYGGQLGHLHDALAIIDAIKYVCESDLNSLVEFNFYVSGAQAAYLQSALSNYPVKILAAVPSNQWRNDIKEFHIGLVSLSSGGASVCLPSKSYAMMAAGMAILAICPNWSDLATLIKQADCGWVINNSVYDDEISLRQGNYLENLNLEKSHNEISKAFYYKIRNILSNNEELFIKRENAYNVVRSKYNINSLRANWTSLINEINN